MYLASASVRPFLSFGETLFVPWFNRFSCWIRENLLQAAWGGVKCSSGCSRLLGPSAVNSLSVWGFVTLEASEFVKNHKPNKRVRLLSGSSHSIIWSLWDVSSQWASSESSHCLRPGGWSHKGLSLLGRSQNPCSAPPISVLSLNKRTLWISSCFIQAFFLWPSHSQSSEKLYFPACLGISLQWLVLLPASAWDTFSFYFCLSTLDWLKACISSPHCHLTLSCLWSSGGPACSQAKHSILPSVTYSSHTVWNCLFLRCESPWENPTAYSSLLFISAGTQHAAFSTAVVCCMNHRRGHLRVDQGGWDAPPLNLGFLSMNSLCNSQVNKTVSSVCGRI